MKKIYILTLTILSLVTFTQCKKESKAPEKITREELYAKLLKAKSQITNLVETKKAEYRKLHKGPSISNDPPIDWIMTEEEASFIVTPLIAPTASYVSSEYSVNLYDYFETSDPNIATIGYAVMRIEQLDGQDKTVEIDGDEIPLSSSSKVSNDILAKKITGNKTMGTSGSINHEEDVYDCALRSVGITALVTILNAGISQSLKYFYKSKAVRKAIMKVVGRYMGVLGAAWAIYEFVDCVSGL